MNSLLETKDLTITFGGLAAVKDVNIEIREGEILGIIGPNGAGKTTLFNLLTGVYQATSGEIWYKVESNYMSLKGIKPYKIATLGIGRTFQNIRLFENLSVLENVIVSLNADNHVSVIADLLRLPKFYKKEEAMRESALKLLDIFGLKDKADLPSTSLAYGEQRLLEIVRALALNPRILFLDEPAAGMNHTETNDLMSLIRRIKDEFNLTVVLIEHDMNLVMGITERIYVLEYGRLLATGTPEEIQNNPEVIKAYLGGDE
ncbi:MAG: ABC transporter ATP-binding protein [Lactobacillales bacterium]|jgi:branched-chain amino acid transport system ATP-binding protein|nr:ABC transporter ATP-binding protein [Lactobacillales bacterium]